MMLYITFISLLKNIKRCELFDADERYCLQIAISRKYMKTQFLPVSSSMVVFPSVNVKSPDIETYC